MVNERRWSVKGISPECREAAKIAARRAGMPLGEWLNRTIMVAVREELGGKSGSDAQLPSLPLAELINAIEFLVREIKEENQET